MMKRIWLTDSRGPGRFWSLAVAVLVCLSLWQVGASATGSPVMMQDMSLAKGELADMTLGEYLEKGEQEWFLTGKKQYTVQAMMVSEELSFHNELESTDYTVTDDNTTVVMKGPNGEMWASKLSNVMQTYTLPDGSALKLEDFAVKDVFIDIMTIASPGSNYAMFIPKSISVTVETGQQNVLHTNLPNVPHGDGDFLVCRTGPDGKPDLSDVWVLNGISFLQNYDTQHLSILMK